MISNKQTNTTMKLNKYSNHKKPPSISSGVLNENSIISNSKDRPSADIFNVLRTKVLVEMRANDWNVLAITSPRADAGKTFIAANLAISISQEENHSALLADFDFRHPTLQKYFGITSKKGLSDYFYDDLPLSELLFRPDMEGLVVLPAGKPVQKSSELFSSSKMGHLVSDLKNKYSDRIIIIDLPPLLGISDAMTFLPKTDACLLIVAEAETEVADLKQSMQLIDEKKFLGSVFNKSTEASASIFY
jgi:capsular exopolysaccharide synthesis family protein